MLFLFTLFFRNIKKKNHGMTMSVYCVNNEEDYLLDSLQRKEGHLRNGFVKETGVEISNLIVSKFMDLLLCLYNI